MHVLKQLIVLILISVGVIFLTPALQPIIHLLVAAHDWIAQLLLQVFAGGTAGNIARQLIALLAFPIILALIPTIIFYAAKRRMFPYFMEVVWVLWLLQTTPIIAMYKAAAPA